MSDDEVRVSLASGEQQQTAGPQLILDKGSLLL
jgi:hypothetical protein